MCLGCGVAVVVLSCPFFFFLKDVFGMVAKLKLLTYKEVKPKQLPYCPGALAGSLSLVSLMVSRACFCEWPREQCCLTWKLNGCRCLESNSSELSRDYIFLSEADESSGPSLQETIHMHSHKYNFTYKFCRCSLAPKSIDRAPQIRNPLREGYWATEK